ncbi:hypothetical protein IAT38_001786 [Cryptococcus sp. DSM 104549]
MLTHRYVGTFYPDILDQLQAAHERDLHEQRRGPGISSAAYFDNPPRASRSSASASATASGTSSGISSGTTSGSSGTLRDSRRASHIWISRRSDADPLAQFGEAHRTTPAHRTQDPGARRHTGTPGLGLSSATARLRRHSYLHLPSSSFPLDDELLQRQGAQGQTHSLPPGSGHARDRGSRFGAGVAPVGAAGAAGVGGASTASLGLRHRLGPILSLGQVRAREGRYIFELDQYGNPLLPLGVASGGTAVAAAAGEQAEQQVREHGLYAVAQANESLQSVATAHEKRSLSSLDTAHHPPPYLHHQSLPPSHPALPTNSHRRTMSRPTHIALPPASFSPTGSPVHTPPGQTSAGPQGAQSPTSPRHSFLGFMRTRGRSSTMTHGHTGSGSTGGGGLASPNLDRTATAGGGFTSRMHSREQSAGGAHAGARGGSAGTGATGSGAGAGDAGLGVTRSVSTPLSGGLTLPPRPTPTASPRLPPPGPLRPSPLPPPGKTFRIRLVPHLESQRSLPFDPVIRELFPISLGPSGSPSAAAQATNTNGVLVNGKTPALLLKIGRFTDKSPALPVPSSAPVLGGGSAGGTLGPDGGYPYVGVLGMSSGYGGGASAGASGAGAGRGSPANLTVAGGGGDVTSSKVAFKSKVVSRSHAEIWCEPGGKFFIRDTSSSSGTFLNHIRLSSPNSDSRPTLLNDGDVLQLGVDYQGGTEEMFRCVKMRVEIGREWQRGANEFNTNALKQLKALGGATDTPESKGKAPESTGKKSRASVSVTDCCICLFSVTVCQSLFIAPCSHVFHYKCIRPLLLQHHPGFSCPLCRTFANLEEDVETEDAWEIASRRASVKSRRPSNHSIILAQQGQPTSAEPPVAAAGQGPTPGTALELGGGATASVEDLLPAPAAPSDEASGSAPAQHPERPGTNGEGSALARQYTAVAPVSGQGEDLAAGTQPPLPPAPAPAHGLGYAASQVPFAVPEEPAPFSSIAPIVTGSLPVTISRPTGEASPAEGYNAFSEAATPMNDTFLSTLAPGMMQRLALADDMSNAGTAGTGTASVSGGSGASAEGSRRASAEGSSERGHGEVVQQGQGGAGVGI